MPWGPFMLTVLFGLIYGNRLIDKNFQRLSAPYAANVKNSDAERVALLEGIANGNFISENADVNDALLGQPRKKSYSCPQSKDFERYFGFMNCERNQLKDYENSNNLRDHNIPYDFKYIRGTNDVSSKSKTANSKIENGLTSEIDLPYNMKMLLPSQPDISNYNIGDNYDDLLNGTKNVDTKRGAGGVAPIGCDCKIKNDLLDLGQRHFPRYLLNAVCQSEDNRENFVQPKCWQGICKPLEYKVKVLTFRTIRDYVQKDSATAWLPDDLRQLWKFKTVTVAAGCFCAMV